MIGSRLLPDVPRSFVGRGNGTVSGSWPTRSRIRNRRCAPSPPSSSRTASPARSAPEGRRVRSCSSPSGLLLQADGCPGPSSEVWDLLASVNFSILFVPAHALAAANGFCRSGPQRHEERRSMAVLTRRSALLRGLPPGSVGCSGCSARPPSSRARQPVCHDAHPENSPHVTSYRGSSPSS